MYRNVAPLTVAEALALLGTVFQVFGEHTQDSGHISYGIRAANGTRYFVKTAGHHAPSPGGTSHAQRVQVLRRAAGIQLEHPHPALIPVRQVLEAPDGIAVVYEWFAGDLLRAAPDRREHPEEAHHRFRQLPAPELARALDAVIDLHAHLATHGWVAGDFYDGCLMYDFQARQIRFMDLECYRRGSYVNTVGRLPGSTRFMAPEEFQQGASIDHRTTVFNLGRLLEIFAVPQLAVPALTELMAVATHPNPGQRPDSPVTFLGLWRAAVGDLL